MYSIRVMDRLSRIHALYPYMDSSFIARQMFLSNIENRDQDCSHISGLLSEDFSSWPWWIYPRTFSYLPSRRFLKNQWV